MSTDQKSKMVMEIAQRMSAQMYETALKETNYEAALDASKKFMSDLRIQTLAKHIETAVKAYRNRVAVFQIGFESDPNKRPSTEKINEDVAKLLTTIAEIEAKKFNLRKDIVLFLVGALISALISHFVKG